MKTINDWEPETLSLLTSLTSAGFVLVSGHNGEEKFRFDGDIPKFIANLTACDESHLFVTSSTGKKPWLYLVYGNNPGELVSDYVCDTGLDAVVDAHYEKWSGRKQPTKPSTY